MVGSNLLIIISAAIFLSLILIYLYLNKKIRDQQIFAETKATFKANVQLTESSNSSYFSRASLPIKAFLFGINDQIIILPKSPLTYLTVASLPLAIGNFKSNKASQFSQYLIKINSIDKISNKAFRIRYHNSSNSKSIVIKVLSSDIKIQNLVSAYIDKIQTDNK